MFSARKAANHLVLLLLQISISALVAVASPLTPPILLQHDHLNLNNATLSQNLSSSVSNNPNALPPNYWSSPIPGPGNRQVIFYNYGYPLSPAGLEEVIGAAYRDATFRHQASERILTFGHPLRYIQRRLGPGTRVLVSFNPGPGVITWGDWANTVVALEEFTLRWDNVALNFVVRMEGEGGERLGIGVFV